MHFGAIWGDIYTRFIFLIALFLTSQTAATSEKPCTAGLTRVPAYKIGIVHDPSNWKSRRALHWIKYAATNVLGLESCAILGLKSCWISNQEVHVVKDELVKVLPWFQQFRLGRLGAGEDLDIVLSASTDCEDDFDYQFYSLYIVSILPDRVSSDCLSPSRSSKSESNSRARTIRLT